MAVPTHKLSKLQRFILLEALAGWEQIQRQLAKEAATNPVRALSVGPPAQQADSIYNPKSSVLYLNLKLPHPSQYPHTTRNDILTRYFGLWENEYGEKWGGKLNAKRSPLDYPSANASFYRAIKRLETRGLIRRGTKYQRGDLWLTESGIKTAQILCISEADR